MPPAERESLGYLFNETNFHLFIDYCMDGLCDKNGDYLVDPCTGGQITGLLNWLRGASISDANFYLTSASSPLPDIILFVLVVPVSQVSWTTVPGLRFFERNGEMSLNQGKNNLGARRDLDDALGHSEDLFKLVPQNKQRDLAAALRGDPGTGLDAVLSDIGSEELTQIVRQGHCHTLTDEEVRRFFEAGFCL